MVSTENSRKPKEENNDDGEKRIMTVNQDFNTLDLHPILSGAGRVKTYLKPTGMDDHEVWQVILESTRSKIVRAKTYEEISYCFDSSLCRVRGFTS